MFRSLPACVTILAAAAAPCGAALLPAQVLVVANADSDESVALAKFYANARGIPGSNVVTVSVTTGYAVTRADYDARIAAPLMRAIVGRRLGGIRAVALMWGVPVRVAGPVEPVDSTQSVYRAAVSKAHQRMAMDYRLLDTVGRKFPEPRTEGLTPLEKLFDPSLAAPPKKLPPLKSLRDDLFRLLAGRQFAVRGISDPARKRIAQRQMMALHLDLTGLRGLIRFIKDTSPDSPPDADELKRRFTEAVRELAALRRAEATPENLRKKLEKIQAADGLLSMAGYASKHIIRPPGATKTSSASVDSELALLFVRQTSLAGAATNPLHWRVRQMAAATGRKIPPVLMTARIDGPSSADAMRMVKDSVEVERTGLKGTFYIDAGAPPRLKGGGERYDELFTTLDAMLRKHSKLKVVMDTKPTLFAEGACPDAGLYVGWYSLARYVPSFTWRRGAVGWHVASFEARHLRDPKTNEWCAKMIQNGVAATIGPVEEPFLNSFPLPTEFFPLLLTGKWTLAECYWRTCPTVSWHMTLIGDPLYRPFAVNPQLPPGALSPGLAPQ